MIYGYARVSTQSQADNTSLDSQERQLLAAGADIVIKAVESAATNDRAALQGLLDKLEEGDTLIVTKLDRLTRSVAAGTELIDALRKKKVNINILNMPFLNDDATGKLMLDIFVAFAQFEREMINERMKEGKAIARTKAGFREGRPPRNPDQIAHAVELLKDYSYNEVERITGIPKSSLIRYHALAQKGASTEDCER